MKIFVIHRGTDYPAIIEIKKAFDISISNNLLVLTSDAKCKNWFNEAKQKINLCDMVLYVLGRTTYESENVDKEIKYALKKKKQIILYKLYPQEDNTINDCLFKKDPFTNLDKKLFKEINELGDLERIFKIGYNFDIGDKLNDTKEPKREGDLIEQYKTYLATSEDLLTRRQNTSNFYTTLNTSIITILITIASVILGVSSISNNLLIVSIVTFFVSIIGVLLNINWLSLLESYGRLNSAKMQVITEMEKSLPANVYDTEWKIMSEKLYDRKYTSFTSIEKRLPFFFILMFSLFFVASISIFIISLI